MKLLQDYASVLSGLLKDQLLQDGASYRLMHYVIRQPVEKGLLLYNVLTRAVVFLSSEEAQKMEMNPSYVPELVSKWFAVPLDHDDRKLALEVRAVGKMLEKRSRGINNYTILTTTDCNARCFYCYEKGLRRIPMEEETARKVVEFIIRNNPGKKVRLRWFGGEPLYNKGVITSICKGLKDIGVEYRSSMVSNGFLFDDETVAEAVDLWNLEKVQITLDGTEDVYNRSKAFIYPECNAYRRVLGNIHRLVNAGVRVTVRLNIDRHNADDLLDLADILVVEFGGQDLLEVYSRSLFEASSKGTVVSHTDVQRRELFDARMRLQEKLKKGKIAVVKKLPHQLKLNRCIADDDASVLILPDGRLGKCGYCLDDHWFGSLDSSEWDETILADFKRIREEIDACVECPLYPECFRLALCEETVHCYPEEREERLLQVRESLLNFYQKKRDEVPD